MRTSGKDTDFVVIVVPVVLLIVIGVVLAGDPRRFFSAVERQLWHGVDSVSHWLSTVFS